MVGQIIADGKVSLSLSQMLGPEEKKCSAGSGSEEETNVSTKKNFQPYHAQSVPKPQNLEANAFERQTSGESQPVTTMMLRNIPNKYTQNSLLQEINDLGFSGTFDFFYLPMDVHNRSNVGYAFINFLLPEDAERFRQAFSEHHFQRFQSRKISSVCTAHVQGLDENMRHFENRAVTHARNDQYRPVVLRNGARVDIEEAFNNTKVGTKALPSPPSTPLAQASQALQHPPAVAAPRVSSKGGVPGAAGAAQQKKNVNGGKTKKTGSPAIAPPAAHVSGAGKRSPMTPTASMAAGRTGLENAIRGLLSPAQQQQQQQSAMMVAPPGLPSYARGANNAGAAAMMGTHTGYNAETAQGSDIMQLLSLRSLILDRLLQKDEAYHHAAALMAAQQLETRHQLHQQERKLQMQMTPPFAPTSNWQDPAYIELGPSAYGAKYGAADGKFHHGHDDWDQAEATTPRTHAMAGSGFRGMLDERWRLH
ncbi:unnamed protein product [Polarella glacialis]|uniref:RRM domain-containing protein n=1 Tax=Polarella glacialis TaxID=89957 RepID=A0A813KZW8_POLGL|nr:unnamed protein product [Polarella glacialis]